MANIVATRNMVASDESVGVSMMLNFISSTSEKIENYINEEKIHNPES